MTPRQLREFRQRLGMTQKEFAKHICVTTNSIARWERGEMKMRPTVERLLELLVRETDLTSPNAGKEK